MLFPDEISLFPKENVRPGLGVGRSPRLSGFKVVSYQLTVANCPHFEDNKCSIYEVRPMVCKEYPFKVKYDFQQFSLGLASECTWVHELKKKHPNVLGSNFFDTGEIRSGRTLMFKMRDYYVLRDTKAKQWVYSLKTRKWQRNARASYKL